MGLGSSSLYYCCTLAEGGCLDYETPLPEIDEGIYNCTVKPPDEDHLVEHDFCNQAACDIYYSRNLNNETCYHLKYGTPLTESQQWILAMVAAIISVLLSYLSLFCLSVLFSPGYAIFRVFLSSFSLSLLIAMAMFELVPATIGMNECEMALWPHWPVHAAVMFIVFWLFYAMDRTISVVGSRLQDKRMTYTSDRTGWSERSNTTFIESLTEVERIRADSKASGKIPMRDTVTSITVNTGRESVKGTSFGTSFQEEDKGSTPEVPPMTKNQSRRASFIPQSNEATFLPQTNEAFQDEEDFNYQQKGVLQTKRTTILRAPGTDYERKSVRISEYPASYQDEPQPFAFDAHDEGQIHKHGISCENLKMISGTAWVSIVGDSIENVVHGIAIAAAFNESFPAGIGITIAFCIEEFLHKLNDF